MAQAPALCSSQIQLGGTQRVLGVGEGPGCPSGQGWKEAEILVHRVGQGGLLSQRVPGGARR